MRRRPRGWRPTRRLGGVVALCVVAYGLAAQAQSGWLYVGLAALAGALPLGLLYPLCAVRGLRCSARVVSPAEGMREDEKVTITLTLSNPGRLPRYWLSLHDHSGLSGDGGATPVGTVAVLAARGHVQAAWPVRPARRGVFTIPALQVASRAPFGLASAWAPVVSAGTEVVVAPRWWALPPGPRGSAGGEGSHVRRRPTQGSEFFGTRPYRGGDNIRWVHWRSSARRGELIVREFEDPARPALTVVLDAEAGPDPRLLDVGVRIAASAAHWTRQQGYVLNLYCTSTAPPSPGNAVSVARADDFLARVLGDGAAPVEQLLRRLPLATIGLVVIPGPRPGAVDALLAWHRRGTALTVAVGRAHDGAMSTFVDTLRAGGVTVVPFEPDAVRVDLSLW